MSTEMKTKLLKILKGTLISVAAATLVYIEGEITKTEYGFGPTLVAIAGTIINILKVFLSKIQVAPALAAMVLLGAGGRAEAQTNLASKWSFGPTIPFFTGEFDSVGTHGGFHGGVLNAGAGVTLNRNLFPNAAGDISYLTIGVPIFGAFQGGDPSTFKLIPGITLGTFNNVLAAGVGVKVLDVAPGRMPAGVFADGFDRSDIVLLLAFSFNLGGGTTPPNAAFKSVGAAGAELPPPPNYAKLW